MAQDDAVIELEVKNKDTSSDNRLFNLQNATEEEIKNYLISNAITYNSSKDIWENTIIPLLARAYSRYTGKDIFKQSIDWYFGTCFLSPTDYKSKDEMNSYYFLPEYHPYILILSDVYLKKELEITDTSELTQLVTVKNKYFNGYVINGITMSTLKGYLIKIFKKEEDNNNHD